MAISNVALSDLFPTTVMVNAPSVSDSASKQTKYQICIELHECRNCGALVREEQRERHWRFHDMLRGFGS